MKYIILNRPGTVTAGSDLGQPAECATNTETTEEASTTVDYVGEQDRLVDMATMTTMLGICARTVHRLVASNELPGPVKVGRASRWFTSDVNRYLSKLEAVRKKSAVQLKAGGVS